MPGNAEIRTLELDEVRALAHACLVRAGADDASSTAVAATVTDAEADGCPAHGLFRIPGYCAALQAGRANGRAAPHITQPASAVLRMDADRALAPRALSEGLAPLARCARDTGVAALAIVNTFHFAALWHEVEALAGRGLVALAMTGSRAFVAPSNGSEAVFGTNPMAFAWPRADALPLVFDQASSALSRGDIMIAARDGHTVADGVGIDARGEPTRDPTAILSGAQLPFGGYKGAAIALMIELLVGPLLGECLAIESSALGIDDEGPVRGGELLIALDPDRLRGDAGWAAQAEALFRSIERQPGARLPAARRHRNRALSRAEGIQVPRALYDGLIDIGDWRDG